MSHLKSSMVLNERILTSSSQKYILLLERTSSKESTSSVSLLTVMLADISAQKKPVARNQAITQVYPKIREDTELAIIDSLNKPKGQSHKFHAASLIFRGWPSIFIMIDRITVPKRDKSSDTKPYLKRKLAESWVSSKSCFKNTKTEGDTSTGWENWDAEKSRGIFMFMKIQLLWWPEVSEFSEWLEGNSIISKSRGQKSRNLLNTSAPNPWRSWRDLGVQDLFTISNSNGTSV